MAEKVLEIPESDEFYLTDNAKSVRWQLIYVSKWVRLGRCINLRRYSCVLTGIIGTLPVGYIDVTDTIATVTVNIVVE